MKTIVAIGAHTGDAQLTCGMLLAKHAMAGDKIVTIDLTAGERGCPPGYTTAEFREKNVASAKEFATLLGGESIVLDTPDGELVHTHEKALELGDLLRSLKANAVLCHWKNSMHKDHIVASKLSQDAVFFASLPTIERPLPATPIRTTLYAENWEDAEDFHPYTYFDVTEAYPLWREAIVKLWLTENSRDFKYLQYYDALSRMRGALIKTERATAYGIEAYQYRQVLQGL